MALLLGWDIYLSKLNLFPDLWAEPKVLRNPYNLLKRSQNLHDLARTIQDNRILLGKVRKLELMQEQYNNQLLKQDLPPVDTLKIARLEKASETLQKQHAALKKRLQQTEKEAFQQQLRFQRTCTQVPPSAPSQGPRHPPLSCV